MTLRWVIAGTLGQLMLSVVLLMYVAFSGAGVANGKSAGRLTTGMIDVSLYALPLSGIVCAAFVAYLYKIDANSSAYWWYAAPLLPSAIFTVFIMNASRQ